MEPFKQHLTTLAVHTRPRSFRDITKHVCDQVTESGVAEGLLTLFIQHTSASLVIQENADPDVLADLADALDSAAPRDRRWRHDAEGPDDMPAHVKSALTGASVSIPVMNRRPALGMWQAIYVAEHRDQPHQRQVVLHIFGT